MKASFLAGILAGLWCVCVAAADMALTVDEPSGVPRQGWPVTSGIPFAQGALADPSKVTLLDDEGRSLPLQTGVLSRWPDGSVRWPLLDFQVDPAPRQKKQFTLRLGVEARGPSPASSLRVIARNHGTTIETGPLRLDLSREGFSPLAAAWLDLNRDRESFGKGFGQMTFFAPYALEALEELKERRP
jgi:hypothetical protein